MVFFFECNDGDRVNAVNAVNNKSFRYRHTPTVNGFSCVAYQHFVLLTWSYCNVDRENKNITDGEYCSARERKPLNEMHKGTEMNDFIQME